MVSYVIIGVFISIVVFQTTAATYDAKLGEEIYQYSRPAYCNQEKLKQWNCGPCQRHPNMKELQVFYNSSNEGQGYCGFDADNNRVVIGIRGSTDVKNWEQNINFIMEAYNFQGCSGCKVHRGFHNVYEDIVNNLLACAYTLTANHPKAEVVVTGHSLGAAQSTFAAIEIQKIIHNVDIFYNYGNPRVGNKAFADYVESTLKNTKIARITHWKDPFIHGGTQAMGFEHYGPEVFFNQDSSSYTQCGREDNKCADQFFWPFQWVTNDHLYYFQTCAGCEDNTC